MEFKFLFFFSLFASQLLCLSEDEMEMIKANEKNCNREVLISYGLKGLNKAQISTHKYCPQIRENCCSSEDVEKQISQWENQVKFEVELYYSTYLYALKYTFGFSSEAYRLAFKTKNSPQFINNPTCQEAAENIISLNLNVKNTQDIYKEIKQGVKNFSKLRSGFGCIICNSQTQDKIMDTINNDNKMQNVLYLSKQFCEKLVDKNITASFYLVNYVKRFLNNLSMLFQCNDPQVEKLTFDIPIDIQKQVMNCFHFHDRYFFYFCESYCEIYDMASANPIFDGYVSELEKFVELIKKQRHV